MGTPNPQDPAWYRILEAARELSGRDRSDFTSADLAARAGIRPTGVGTPNQVASAWLGKLRGWGYVEVVGSAPKGPGRPANIFRITEKGLGCRPEPGFRQRLIDAIRHFQAAYGTKAQDAAFRVLVAAADQVEREFEERRAK